jgi:hypothetical protein
MDPKSWPNISKDPLSEILVHGPVTRRWLAHGSPAVMSLAKIPSRRIVGRDEQERERRRWEQSAAGMVREHCTPPEHFPARFAA